MADTTAGITVVIMAAIQMADIVATADVAITISVAAETTGLDRRRDLPLIRLRHLLLRPIQS